MKIIFFGADPWFSPPVLAALVKAKHEILLTVSKDKFRTAEDVKKENLKEKSQTAKPDAIALAAFGPPFLPAEVLGWPKYGCLNVHASLLPRWRGASPVFAAIKNGDKKTGVSVMRMTEAIDRGPILGQRKTAISELDNRESLTKKLGKLGGQLMVDTLKKLENDQIKFIKQPLKSPTPYTHKLTKKDGRINWSKSPAEIERLIRAATPWPGAWTKVKNKNIERIKILAAHLKYPGNTLTCSSANRRIFARARWGGSGAPIDFSGEKSGSVRKIQNKGELVIDLVQLAGKNPVSWKQFIAGHPGINFP